MRNIQLPIKRGWGPLVRLKACLTDSRADPASHFFGLQDLGFRVQVRFGDQDEDSGSWVRVVWFGIVLSQPLCH